MFLLDFVEKFALPCSLVMPEVLAVFSYPSSCQYASCFDSAASLDAHLHQQLKNQVGKLYKTRTIRQYCLASCGICKTTPTGTYFLTWEGQGFAVFLTEGFDFHR